MKIGVLIKQVPDTETRIKLAAGGKGIDESGIKWVVNPYDEFAIEAALQLKQAAQAEVVVFAAGPARVVDALRTALAMGADRAVRINTDGVSMDPYTAAIALAAAVQGEGCDLVLGGKQAMDDDAGQVIQGVAERLGWPMVSVIDTLTLEADGKSVVVRRPVAGGVKEVIGVQLPAVLGCDKGLNAPRYPSLPGIMKAKSKPVVEKSAAELLAGESAQWEIVETMLPPERQAGKKITGTAEETADQLIAWLRNDAKLF
ncbi:MAG: electron transfer flavoprotein subunit beta/FixA family protein [Deltaproteobacteria bacterium]|nr:electron transfer flavoprotein subunit beta/FixA family protein [Deltaproteobacteria bacterium]